MRVYIVRKLKTVLIGVLTTMLLFVAVSLVLNKNSVTYAEESAKVQTTLFLPNTKLEYYALDNPTDAYSDDTLTAIVQNNSLVLNVDGEWKNPLSIFQNLKQVKRLDQNTLLISDDGSLYSISLSGSTQKTLLTYDNSSIGSNYFDVNENYFVTAYSGRATIYSSEDTAISSKVGEFLGINADYPITLNDNDEIFYINTSGKLCKRTIGNLNSIVELAPVQPYKMIADNSYVYYVLSNNANIYRLSVNGGESYTLPVQQTAYDLGTPISPSALSFRNENLLITDATNSIQEFKIENDSLVFTGFAIAKNKTAYNRISDTVINVEKYGDTLAVLDQSKLSIINANSNFSAYNKDNFVDYFASDLGDKMPFDFALGSHTALLTYIEDTVTNFGSFRILNLKDRSIKHIADFESTTIHDVCYQSGVYYALVAKGTSYKIYKADESASELKFTETNVPVDQYTAAFTVDVFGNVYTVDSLQSKIHVYSLNDDSLHSEYSFTGKVKELATDLNGSLYVLKDKSVLYLDSNSTWQEIDIAPASIDVSANIKSFAMDYITNSVYFVYENREFVYKTSELGNLAITSLEIPQSYITTATSANWNNFKVYKPTDNANVYSISKSQTGFQYKSLVNERAEYALITQISVLDAFGKELNLLALAGQNDVVLINAKECVPVTIEPTVAPEKAFITTDVHMYYLPIFTSDDGYALSNDIKIRLPKNTAIAPEQTFEFLGYAYYFASVEVNGTTVTGYVPKNFTVEVLSEDLKWNSYTTEWVNKTQIYSDNQLENSIDTLERGTKVRVYEKNGNIYKVAYLVNETDWVMGYINGNAIQNPANVAIRNILIILAVTACVCGTTSYFLLRRKVK